MSVLVVPPLDEQPFPTLGLQVCDFIEAYLVHGPGDLLGQPVTLDAETRALLYRAYEVFLPGHAQAGRRRFTRVAWSMRKGSAKTEKAAWVAAVELHPDGPVRCDGFDASGSPVGRGVRDPYVAMLAYTEEQTEELAYGALRMILERSGVAEDFDIGLERIIRADGTGKAVPLAGSPSARDGSRVTFMHFDETHRMTMPNQRAAHETLLAAIPKRPAADPWGLETTTAPEPGGGSVAESTFDYAEAVAERRIADSRLFFFHREASDVHDLDDPVELRSAILEASGPAVGAWSDVEGIAALFADPQMDLQFLERIWLNRRRGSAAHAFDSTLWAAAADPMRVVADGSAVVLGFDGSLTQDATALVGVEVESGHLFLVDCWERPFGPAATDWEVPLEEVESAVGAAFDRWHVVRLYADPPFWREVVAAWRGRFGDAVFEWWTNRDRQMAFAVRAFAEAFTSRALTHDGSDVLRRHVGNAVRKPLPRLWDESDRPLFVLRKERRDSPKKIDAAMAAVLAWEARRDAVAAGQGRQRPRHRAAGF